MKWDFETVTLFWVFGCIFSIIVSSHFYYAHKNSVIAEAIRASGNPVLAACAFDVGTVSPLCAVAISKTN